MHLLEKPETNFCTLKNVIGAFVPLHIDTIVPIDKNHLLKSLIQQIIIW